MGDLISVIVPVFNTEKYLPKCIESIVNQDYKLLEIILINDGSTDGSGEICDYYAGNDKRIDVIHNTVNRGVSAARNKGIELAAGEYISFIDSDDHVHPEMMKRLIQLSKENDADLIACDFEKLYNGRTPACSVKEARVEILNNIAALYKIFETDNEKSVVLTNKLFRAKLFSSICFPEGRIYEDVYITYKLFHKANKIVYTNEILYFHIERDGSITAENDFDKIDAIDAGAERNEYFKKNNLNGLYIKSAERYLLSIIKQHNKFKRNQRIGAKKRIEMKERFSRELKRLAIMNELSLRRKINLWLFDSCPDLHYRIFAWRKKLTKFIKRV